MYNNNPKTKHISLINLSSLLQRITFTLQLSAEVKGLAAICLFTNHKIFCQKLSVTEWSSHQDRLLRVKNMSAFCLDVVFLSAGL